MANLSIKNDSTGENGIKVSNEIEIIDMPPREMMVVLDKLFAGNEQVFESDGNLKTTFTGFDKYHEALSTQVTDADSTGLDLKDFDVRDPGDLIQLLRDMLEEAELNVNTGLDPDGKRNLSIELKLKDKTFTFNGDDLKKLTEIGATGLDNDEDETGGEEIAENGIARKESVRKLIRKIRATNDGDDDTLSNDNRNTLFQTKIGFVVTSVLDANLNVGLNGTLAIFIA